MKSYIVCFLLLGSWCSIVAANRLPSWPWSWTDPVHTLTWGTSAWTPASPPSVPRIDPDYELDILLQQDIVYVQGFDFAGELHTDNFTNALEEVSTLKAYQKGKGSKKPYAVLTYRGIVVGPPALWNDTAYTGFWLTDDAGVVHPGVWDFRNASARQYYIDDLWSLHQDSQVDGLFIDTGDAVCMGYNLTVSSRRAIFNGTAVLWRDLSKHFNSQGREFMVTPSLKNHFPSQNYEGPVGEDGRAPCNETTPMSVPCAPYSEDVLYEIMGEEVLWGAHRQFNVPSRDFGKDPAGCQALVQTAIEEAKRGAAFFTCNDCDNTTAAGHTAFNASFAAYLMAVEKGSYFGAGVHFHAPLWDYQWPDLQRPLGIPKGPATRNGLLFAREFENLIVHMDCSTQTGSIEWKD